MASLAEIFPDGTVPIIERLPPVAADRQLIIEMSNAGIKPPDIIIMDGEIHRFSTSGKQSDKTGWYVVFDGQIPAGAYGCWRLGIDSTWRADIGRELTVIEQMQHTQRMQEAKRARDKAEAERKANAAITATQIWETSALASDDHPYLLKKQIKNPGFRIANDGRLIAPLFIDNEIAGLQYIDADGKKMFMSGSKSGGAYWWLSGANDVVFIAEGVATAASIHAATGNTVMVAFSANNLSAVATTVRQQIGALTKLIIVADNDESGVGLREANKAAEQSKAQVITIPTLGDANDYANQGHDLLALLKPPIIEQDHYLIDADDFSNQPAPIRWLVKGWAQRDALMMIHGPSGGGKTFFVLDLVLTIATGQNQWGDHKCRQGSVVYLAGEGHAGLRGRIAAWKRNRNCASFNSQFHISKSGTDLNTPDGYNLVRNAILSLPQPPDVIVVDTLHRFLVGDENSAQDAKTMLDACGGLMREFNCTVILVHHTGVGEDSQHRARGSSAWRGALDIEISVVPGKDNGPMQLIQRKSKDAELSKPIWMQIETVELDWIDEDGEQVKSAVANIVNDYIDNNLTKENKSLSEARQCFENAIIKYNHKCNLDNNQLILDSDDWSESMLQSSQWETDNARRSAKKRYKKALLDNAMIQELDGNEFLVTNEEMINAITLCLKMRGKT